MSYRSAIHAPPGLRPRPRSALDLLALIAAVLAVALAGYAAVSMPRAAGLASGALKVEARR